MNPEQSEAQDQNPTAPYRNERQTRTLSECQNRSQLDAEAFEEKLLCDRPCTPGAAGGQAGWRVAGCA